MRLVVTGAGGGLGRAFLASLGGHHEVHAFEHAQLDIGDHHAVMATVPSLGPDAVVNLAAFTQVDANEIDPARAFRDNALGPQSLALAAAACDAAMLHVSTDYVFDGTSHAPYDETSMPNPLSVYGRAKLGGEERVRATLPRHMVVRTGYVFGGGTDYLTTQLAQLRRGEPARGIADRVGTPTFVGHLAERLLPLLLTGRWGTYHLAGPEVASWHDVLQRCRALGGFDAPAEPQAAADLGLAAPRPMRSALVSSYLTHLDVAPMPPLDDGLRAVLG